MRQRLTEEQTKLYLKDIEKYTDRIVSSTIERDRIREILAEDKVGRMYRMELPEEEGVMQYVRLKSIYDLEEETYNCLVITSTTPNRTGYMYDTVIPVVELEQDYEEITLEVFKTFLGDYRVIIDANIKKVLDDLYK